MTRPWREEMVEISRRALAALDRMTPEQRVERLKEIGLLDRNGEIPINYGGPGEFCGPEGSIDHVPYGPTE